MRAQWLLFIGFAAGLLAGSFIAPVAAQKAVLLMGQSSGTPVVVLTDANGVLQVAVP